MKKSAVVVGANGVIGHEITTRLRATHDVIGVGRSQGDILADYTDPGSVQAMFEQIGHFDDLIAVVGGDTAFKRYDQLDDEDYQYGFERKFLAQVRLVRLGSATANDEASFTLSSGYLSHYPNPGSVATGIFNAAVDTFVYSTAPLLPRGLRLNVVSPAPVVTRDLKGHGTITAAKAADAYLDAVHGVDTGQVLRPWGGLEVPALGQPSDER